MNEIEKAIEQLDVQIKSTVNTVSIKSCQLAIEALEKQIPKKPSEFDGTYCGSCEGKLARQTDLIMQKFCHHCGQKLDWNVEE